jgi:SAM-dependent methyltransferase
MGRRQGAGAMWTENDVVEVSGAELVVRTYIEQAAVRRYLTSVAGNTRLGMICDIGAGYGRMSCVLTEFSDCVVAFEREQLLVRKGSYLLPSVQFRRADSLESLPAGDSEFDFALTFTVLQHLADPLARAALAEAVRIVRPGGYILLCEETDTAGQPAGPNPGYRARSLDQYGEWLSPGRLVASSPRVVERSSPRSSVGSYMLFRTP